MEHLQEHIGIRVLLLQKNKINQEHLLLYWDLSGHQARMGIICTGMLFLDNTATQYTQFDSDWPEIYQNYSGVSLWANYILENAGWLK